jgi:hypothetical protein
MTLNRSRITELEFQNDLHRQRIRNLEQQLINSGGTMNQITFQSIRVELQELRNMVRCNEDYIRVLNNNQEPDKPSKMRHS